MYIDGFGISGYKSFSGELQEIGPFAKINLFIGQNNSGKSNILSFLNHQYRPAVAALLQRGLKLLPLDSPLDQKSQEIRVSLGMLLGGDTYHRLLEKCVNASVASEKQAVSELVTQLLNSQVVSRGGNVGWFYFWSNSVDTPLAFDDQFLSRVKSDAGLLPRHWQGLWEALTHKRQGNIDQHWVPETLAFFVKDVFQTPEISLIPAIRRIGDMGSKAEDYSGIGIIDRLAQLQNPQYDEQDRKQHFEEINQFLRKVTGNSTAQLDIPYKRDSILVHMDNKTLPLSSLGTGIHEVVILASAATVLRNQVLCIEEPELHLHPLLQRKLIRYLTEKTDNQYFFTTHSAHLLDSPGAAIFHVRYQDGRSTVGPVHTAAAKSFVCADLGYRASDLLQANSVIWVEGPSDRTYLNHWIHCVDPGLIEGIHYSIMFYGGRLLSHLSANDPEVSDFISLRRLNRYISIVIDSDRASPRGKLNETKSRVMREFDQGPGFAWITKGREIENYIGPAILEAAVKEVHKNAVRLAKTGQFDHCLFYKRAGGRVIENVDKVKVAHEVTKTTADLDVLDLRKAVNRLVKFIRSANDFGAS